MTNIEHLFENALIATDISENVYEAFKSEMQLKYNQMMLKEVSMTADELWEIIQYLRYVSDFAEIQYGEWIKAACSEKDGDAHCSECNHWDWSDCNYCSNCGAKMNAEVK